ncbi:MAG: IclR family transcriptional regulator [Carbonactinosporaceae bacterium]
MSGNSREPGRSVTSKVFAILWAFTPARSELSLTEISRLTGLPGPTAHRLTSEMVRWGGLERLDAGTYRIGLRLWEVGALAPRQRSLRDVALPYMQDLYEATHENVQLAVLDGREALYVEKISGREAVPIISRVGGRLPLHATGVGKILLAHARPALREQVLAGRLERFTPYTIVMPGKLRQALAEVRRSGLAYCYEEMTLGSVSLAAPVRDRPGPVVAALSIVVRSFPVDTQRLAPAVRRAARGLSRELAGQRLPGDGTPAART